MFVKLQYLDTPCFPGLSSTLRSSTVGVSISPPDNLVPISRKSKHCWIPECPNRDSKNVGGVKKCTNNNGGCRQETRLKKASKTEEREPHKRNRHLGNRVVKKDEWEDGNGSVEKVHPKCSTKCLSYGGCIPAILQALDEVSDLDEALKPWKDKLNSKERSIILKEQTSWERALEIFEWFKMAGGYEVNVIHYNIVLRILGKAQKWRLVESLWAEMNKRGINPINSTYGTLIDVYGKGGFTEEALAWLERMNEQRMEPDEVTMGIVVQLYKKAGEFQKAESFFKKWSSRNSTKYEITNQNEVASAKVENSLHPPHVSLSTYTYNTLIDTYGKAGQLQEASTTFENMLNEGVAPTTVTFNTMIHICGNHGKLKEVTLLMQKMEELQCPPDTRTYNILISLHAKHDNIDLASNYFAEMKEACLQPDIVSYRTLLYAYSIRQMVVEAEQLVAEMDERGLEIDEFTQSALTRMYINAEMLEKSWSWFWRFHLTGRMSSECYSANIDAYGERGCIVEAERVFVSCQEEKKLTVLEYNVMIKAYGVVKDYVKAQKSFDSMESNGVTPDKCSYSSLIQILCGADMPAMALSYLRKMQSAGLVSDCIPYSVVISSFSKLGYLEKADELYREMIEHGMQPDIVVYGVLINAFADAGSVREAIGYVDAMKRAGLPGNTVIYNSLIKLYTKVDYLKEAQEAYKMLQQTDDGPAIYSSNCMIDIYSKHSMDKQAEEIFERLKRKGEANEFTFAMMLCMYKKKGRLQEAISIARQMKEQGLLTELLSFNNMISLYAMDGRFKEAVSTFQDMIKASIQPDECTYKSLGVILLKCGVSKQAVRKLELSVKKDAQSGLQAWGSVLSSVVGMSIKDDYL
ncbi:Pentatricopeptide repeat-containing protein, partial [Cucurbita argyrosperma subsp. sororia]